MNKTDGDARRRAWSGYWAAGALHSCANSYAGDYDGAIGDFWRECFGRLQAGARVLDLATGNGALPHLLWQFIDGSMPLRIDAVDQAAVAPAWHATAIHQDIAFHSGMRMEDLPFDDREFDLIVSQYGLEYADWPQALDEAVRVLRPRGELAFVMHHADSVLVRVGRSELENLQLLQSSDGLITVAGEVLPWLERARMGDPAAVSDPAARTVRLRYNGAMQLLGIRAAASPVPDLLLQMREHVHGLFAGQLAADWGMQLQQLRGELEAAQLRTEEMIDCALSVEQMDALIVGLRQRLPQHHVTARPLYQAEGVLGWALTASNA